MGKDDSKRLMSIDEYLGNIASKGMRAAFRAQLLTEKDAGDRTMEQWEKLFSTFKSKPDGMTLKQWAKQGGK